MEHEDVFLGDTIREHRERLLISKAELARRVGVSDVSVLYWESGKIEEIGHNNLIRLARALGLTVSELVGDEGNASMTWRSTKARDTQGGCPDE